MVLNWLRKKRLERKLFFFAIFVALDTRKGALLKNAKIIAEPTLVLAVLRLVKKRFISQMHKCCQKKSSCLPLNLTNEV